MITEDYVSFELAKLLKKKGFDQNCAHYYLDGTIYRHHPTEVLPIGKETFAAPTLAQVVKLLREEKELLISINPTLDKDLELCVMYYIFDTSDIQSEAITSGLYSLGSYNECVSAAIKYCLEKLI